MKLPDLDTLSQKQQSIVEVLLTMERLFSDYPLTELEYTSPLQLLVAVILSAQTTDIQVNKVTQSFFKKLHTPDDLVALWESWIAKYIKTVWLHRWKTKNLFKTGKLLQEKTRQKTQEWWIYDTNTNPWSIRDKQMQYDGSEEIFSQWGYYLPDSLKEMQELAWVWIKTAKVVLYVLYGQKYVAVDTHVHRVMNRLGFVDTKSPNQTSKELEELIPDEYKDVAHRVIIYFWRYLCKARTPMCASCPFQHWCPSSTVS